MVWPITGAKSYVRDPGKSMKPARLTASGQASGTLQLFRLVMDEFALWLNLRDVYWAPEGRASIDAIILFGQCWQQAVGMRRCLSQE
jgi:hypothetical protein